MIKSFRDQLIFISIITILIVVVFVFYSFLHTEYLVNYVTNPSIGHKEVVEEVVKEMSRFARVSFIFSIVLISVFASLTINMILTVIYSFREIIKGIKLIQKGDYTHHINFYTKNEFGTIAQFLNEAVDNIEHFQHQVKAANLALEQKVKDRTSELSQKMQLIEAKNVELSGNKKAMLNILEDQKDLEEELKKEKASIEQQVEERTKELSEKTKALEASKDEVSRGWMQLQQEKARLTASIQSLPQGFFMIDTKNNILVSNKLVSKILGLEKFSFEEILRIFAKSIDLNKYYQTAIKEEKMYEFKDVLYQEKHLRLFLVPIILMQNDKKEVIGVVTLLEDITEAKVIERSRDEFFSIASHELRTPLTSIKGNTSLIQQYYADKLTDKDLAEMISDIHDSAVRLIDIVNDFLDTSRLEQGKITFEKEVFDIVPLIEHIIYEEDAPAKEKNIFLKFDAIAGSFPLVAADTARTKQIVFNLIGNAIKFTDKGGVTIKIDKDDKFVNVHVTDSGKGIPLQGQPLLFRKFQQAENNILTRDSSRSTGLGLYISKLMVEGMGGQIRLESSEEGKGATFTFSLPISPVQKVTLKSPMDTSTVNIQSVSKTNNGEEKKIEAKEAKADSATENPTVAPKKAEEAPAAK